MSALDYLAIGILACMALTAAIVTQGRTIANLKTRPSFSVDEIRKVLGDLEKMQNILGELQERAEAKKTPKPLVVEPPKPDGLNAKAAYLIAAQTDAGLLGLPPILDKIRAAAQSGKLSAKLDLTDTQKVLLFQLGYGHCSDGSVQWSGMEKFNDPWPSYHGRFTMEQLQRVLKEGLA